MWATPLAGVGGEWDEAVSERRSGRGAVDAVAGDAVVTTASVGGVGSPRIECCKVIGGGGGRTGQDGLFAESGEGG